MLGQISGFKLIFSNHCYKTKTVVRGIADKRRPNSKKPLYKRVVIHIPLIYRMGDSIVCAPELEPHIRQTFQQSARPTLLTQRSETIATKQNILSALEAIKQSRSG